ncbi:MAG TPA: aminoacyl-tRNA hydrolase [Puia sp.]|nr:aminoacyl-tRNA hydrolase [Puia sp.]
MSKFLIAGLGNIGPEYKGTRHNIGFDIVDSLVAKHGGQFTVARHAEICELKWKGKILFCIKPTTYMNLSGKAVKYWMDKEKIALENILVVVDEIALPITKLRLKGRGSAAGHNGLISVEMELGTINYPRLRFGAGNDFQKGQQVDYVLSKWSDTELPLIARKVEKSVEVIESFVQTGIERTMNQYNKLEITL